MNYELIRDCDDDEYDIDIVIVVVVDDSSQVSHKWI